MYQQIVNLYGRSTLDIIQNAITYFRKKMYVLAHINIIVQSAITFISKKMYPTLYTNDNNNDYNDIVLKLSPIIKNLIIKIDDNVRGQRLRKRNVSIDLQYSIGDAKYFRYIAEEQLIDNYISNHIKK